MRRRSVYDLKAALMSLTNVPPERQKILGLVKGKLPTDDERMYVCSPPDLIVSTVLGLTGFAVAAI